MNAQIRKIESLENAALNNGRIDEFNKACADAKLRGYKYGRKGYASHVDWMMTASAAGMIIIG